MISLRPNRIEAMIEFADAVFERIQIVGFSNKVIGDFLLSYKLCLGKALVADNKAQPKEEKAKMRGI